MEESDLIISGKHHAILFLFQAKKYALVYHDSPIDLFSSFNEANAAFEAAEVDASVNHN